MNPPAAFYIGSLRLVSAPKDLVLVEGEADCLRLDQAIEGAEVT